MSETAIVPQQQALEPAAMGSALHAYKKLQEELDRAMPDCIMDIKGKQFRKKNYWRAVKTAFNLKVECVNEEKVELDGDWGFMVTYRATAQNGSAADGDGSCTFKEKQRGAMEATLHNIRSQAHTRAFNRAVSNLVGFGEVSAEEVYQHEEKAPKSEVSTAEEQKIDQIRTLILSMAENDLVKSQEILRKATAYKDFKGITHTDDMRSWKMNRLVAVYKKIEEMYNEKQPAVSQKENLDDLPY